LVLEQSFDIFEYNFDAFVLGDILEDV